MTSERGWTNRGTYRSFNKGDVEDAKILQIIKVPGNWGPQYQFELLLKNGLRTMCWIPADESDYNTQRIGRMVMNTFKETHHNLEETIERLKVYGRVYIKCIGFNTRDGIQLPKFRLEINKLPLDQKKTLDIKEAVESG